jgi:hypothetical protein
MVTNGYEEQTERQREEFEVHTSVAPHPDVTTPDKLPTIGEEPPTPGAPKRERKCPMPCESDFLKLLAAPPPPEPVGEVAVAMLAAFTLGAVTTGLLWWSFSRKGVACQA